MSSVNQLDHLKPREIMEQFFYWLGNAANLLSLLTLAVSILTYLKVQSEAKKLQKSLKNIPPIGNLPELIEFHEGIDSPRPVALIFSLIPNVGSIKQPVQNFLISKNWNMPIEEIEMPGITPENISEFYGKVRQKKREILEKGHTEVHLFISGPVQAATIIGNFLSNWMPVKLYHKSQGGQTYEYWSPLVKG